MALIGNQIRQYSDRVVLDSLTASATADYTLQLNSTNFVPSSASSLTVSLNGIIQKPESSYTVSGSTLSFSSALTASDSIDFVIAERGITLQTPSAGSVNTTQLASSAVSTAKIADSAVTYAKSTGFGKVAQVKKLSKTDSFSTTASGDTDITGFSLAITPSSTSSKILVLVSAQLRNAGSGTGNNFINFSFHRDSTEIFNGYAVQGLFAGSTDIRGNVGLSILDEPSTTSEITYKGTLNAQLCTTAYINSTTNPSTITLLEILG